MCSSTAPQRVQTHASVSHARQCAGDDHSHVAQVEYTAQLLTLQHLSPARPATLLWVVGWLVSRCYPVREPTISIEDVRHAGHLGTWLQHVACAGVVAGEEWVNAGKAVRELLAERSWSDGTTQRWTLSDGLPTDVGWELRWSGCRNGCVLTVILY